MFMNVLRPYRPSFRNWLKKNLKKKDQPLRKSGRLGKKNGFLLCTESPQKITITVKIEQDFSVHYTPRKLICIRIKGSKHSRSTLCDVMQQYVKILAERNTK